MTDRAAVSVRGLVEYVYRSGSLPSGFHAAAAMNEGVRIHQLIQKGYREGDRSEVFLKTELVGDGIILAVEGRCDGLLREEDGTVTVEEIKSTSVPPGELGEGRSVHWAQGYLYAYIVATDEELERVTVKLTYVHVERNDRFSLERILSRGELEAFAAETAAAYAPYAKLLASHKRSRNASAGELSFPYKGYREGQRKLAGTVYKAVSDRVGLFAQAPTGIGKTISALFPVVKAMGEGRAERLFYLTAKTVTRLAAEDAVRRMLDGGLKLKAVSLTAKDKICFREEGACTPDHCPFAEGYYDRINAAILDLLENESLIGRETLTAYARKHTVCPFEMSLDTACACDAVICDYNYVFDPRVSLKRLQEEGKRETVLLVDEAHNLVDRGREMFSADLRKSPFLQLQRRCKGVNAPLGAAAKAVNALFIELRKAAAEEGGGVWEHYPEKLPGVLEAFAAAAEPEMANPVLPPPVAPEEELAELYFDVLAMQRALKTYDSRYVTYADTAKGEVRLKLFNLDPSRLLQQTVKGFRSRIYFSATLSPLSYYRDMLGAAEEDLSLRLPSPFRQEQWDISVLPVSTRYTDRDASLGPLAEALVALTAEKGNYLVFFPSHLYLRRVLETFVMRAPQMRTVVQEVSMDEREREAFLAAFVPEPDETLLGFAVMGGIFSEGVDLPGNRLNGVMIVGVGLPQVGMERNLLRHYFDNEGRNGFDYAYAYPGMAKVLQAGGRLIRGETDEGVIVLADDRFLRQPYRDLLPDEWLNYRITGQRQPEDWDWPL